MAKKASTAKQSAPQRACDSEEVPLRSLTNVSLEPQVLPTVMINTGNSPMTYTPQVPGVGDFQEVGISGNCVQVTGGTSQYNYFLNFRMIWVQPGQATLTLYGYACPGEPPTNLVSVPIVAMNSPSFTLVAETGTYTVQVTSVDPATQVSFQMANQPYNESQTSEQFRLSSVLESVSQISSITTYPTTIAPTQWAQNPIKILIQAVTSDQGEYTGQSAVLYGYYLGEYGTNLQFYLDQSQSSTNFSPGRCGIPININEGKAVITIG